MYAVDGTAIDGVETRPRWRLRCCAVMATLVLIAIVGALVYGYLTLRPLVDERKHFIGCLAEQRRLEAAIERAWQQEGIKIWELNRASLDLLVKEKLIPRLPCCPSHGAGSWQQFHVRQRDGRWIVFCSQHGTNELPVGCTIYSSVRQQLSALGEQSPTALARCSTTSRYQGGMHREDVAALARLLGEGP